MDNLDDEIDIHDDDENGTPKINKKKILLFLVPALVIISVLFGIYYITRHQNNVLAPVNYSVIEHQGENKSNAGVTIFYDLPEIEVNLNGHLQNNDMLKVKISIELSRMEDIKVIEALTAKFIDAVIAHTNELTPEEVSGSEGLYWLREELLYRMNLIAHPIKISNLNFKLFEIQKSQ